MYLEILIYIDPLPRLMQEFFSVSVPLLIIPKWILTDVLDQYHKPSFIYYQPKMNDTRIIQAITINPIQSFRMEGIIQSYNLRNRPQDKMATTTLEKSLAHISVIERQFWNEKNILQHNPEAIIIINDQRLYPRFESSKIIEFSGFFFDNLKNYLLNLLHEIFNQNI